ncbi:MULTISPECIES: vWA domain-containing protein [Corynebacterium]|uniref:vWA domain-containing protein n=1 Tax=Corynebacterium TaxID=1716 RepID=UPI00124CA7D6|nr:MULTISPECIES: VWA domain-containing protein [Corynebacterium]
MGEEANPGRRSKALSSEGAVIRSTTHGRGVHVVATAMAAAERGAIISNGRLELRPEDLRSSIKAGRESNLIVFVVDASGSVAGHTRLEAVTGAVESILKDAYIRRDKVAVITVRGRAPELLLPPTSSIDVARRRLESARVGGRTPLAEGLVMADELITRQARKEPGRRAIMVVLSDGRATGNYGMKEAYAAADAITAKGLSGSIVIDCEVSARVRLGLARTLAEHLRAPCVQLAELNSDNVAGAIESL